MTQPKIDYPLIGITGYKGSGKTTIANILVEDFGYESRALADILRIELFALLKDDFRVSEKRHALEMGEISSIDVPYFHNEWGFDEFLFMLEVQKRHPIDQVSSWPRSLMMGWGNMKRDLCGEDYWIDQVPLKPLVVIPDVRYLNEAKKIKEEGGSIIRVHRDGYVSDGHATETEQEMIKSDYTIYNNGTKEQLRSIVRNIFSLEKWIRDGNSLSK